MRKKKQKQTALLLTVYLLMLSRVIQHNIGMSKKLNVKMRSFSSNTHTTTRFHTEAGGEQKNARHQKQNMYK